MGDIQSRNTTRTIAIALGKVTAYICVDTGAVVKKTGDKKKGWALKTTNKIFLLSLTFPRNKSA